jgi:hypothetical protein
VVAAFEWSGVICPAANANFTQRFASVGNPEANSGNSTKADASYINLNNACNTL